MTQRRSQGATSRPELGPNSAVPNKLYFKIGEVAALVGVQSHVLRYWEREVTNIRPSKTVSNQRRYKRQDVETFRKIKNLLYDQRYTLAGAKQCLAQGGGQDTPQAAPPCKADLSQPQPETLERDEEVLSSLQRARRLAAELLVLAQGPFLDELAMRAPEHDDLRSSP